MKMPSWWCNRLTIRRQWRAYNAMGYDMIRLGSQGLPINKGCAPIWQTFPAITSPDGAHPNKDSGNRTRDTVMGSYRQNSANEKGQNVFWILSHFNTRLDGSFVQKHIHVCSLLCDHIDGWFTFAFNRFNLKRNPYLLYVTCIKLQTDWFKDNLQILSCRLDSSHIRDLVPSALL